MNVRQSSGSDLNGLSLAAIVLAVVAVAVVARPSTPARKPNVLQQFGPLLARYCRLWTAAARTDNPAKAAPLYAHDPGLVFYGLGQTEYTGWSAYGQGVKSTLLDNVMSLRFTPAGDLHVTREGNVAWTTSSLRVALTWDNGRSQKFDAQQTAVWEHRDGHWLIVHEHLSSPAVLPHAAGN